MNGKDLMQTVMRVENQPRIPFVDDWHPESSDQVVFSEKKGIIKAPIHKYYGLAEDNAIDIFSMSSKSCYNGVTKQKKDGSWSICFREHCCQYLNYFEQFFDRDKLLLLLYAKVKYMIDAYPVEYNVSSFIWDLRRFFISDRLSPILHYDIGLMNDYNYKPMQTVYKNTKNPCLEYRDIDAKILMEVSLIQCMIIPLISHYMRIHHISNSNDMREFLLRCFDPIYDMADERYGVDLRSKLWETAMTNVGKDCTHNAPLWDMQLIRGINPTIHSESSIESIMIQIVPKYRYCDSIISFNSNVINNEIKYKVTGIPYEYDFNTVSSSIRDEDNNSQTDKFEAYMVKQNEALAVQLRINAMTQMKNLEQKLGPFSEDEINFYIKQLTKDNRHVKNNFQLQLINYLFMKDFGDPGSIQYINNREYVILMLAAKRKLTLNNMSLLSAIIGGRVEKLVGRKTVNKAVLLRMKMTENYGRILNKYVNERIPEEVLFGFIARTIASKFSFIDYQHPEINGQEIPLNKDILVDEFLKYGLMI